MHTKQIIKNRNKHFGYREDACKIIRVFHQPRAAAEVQINDKEAHPNALAAQSEFQKKSLGLINIKKWTTKQRYTDIDTWTEDGY